MSPPPPDDPPSPPPEGSSDLVGEVVAGRYRILSLLGRGAMGSVFLAEHLRMGRRDAVKVLSRSVADDEEARARFTREARNASTINHPNVCTVYDFGEILDGLPFIAMEYVEGETLSELMDREGPLSPERAVRIAAQVCAALDAAHRRDIIHRDLKPDNIMLTRDARGQETVKVVDFGIAKAMREEEDEGRQELTRAGWVVGTPEYVSPEQLKGLEMDGRSDLYSLGIVLFRMLSGRLPFGGESWQEVMTRRLSVEPADLAEATGGRVPDGLVRAVRRVLRRNREARHPDAESFRKDLMSAIEAAGEKGGAPPATVQVREEGGGTLGAGGEPSPTSSGREAGGAGGQRGGRAVPWTRIGWVAGGAVGIAGLVLAGMALLGDDGSGGGRTVAEVALSFPSGPLRVGENLRGAVTVTDSQGTAVDRSTAWRSLDPGIASVGSDGTITGRSEGDARIVATAGGVADTASLRVQPRPAGPTEPPPVADVTLSFPSGPLRVGEDLRGAVTVTDSQGIEVDRSASWRSLDPGIASVAGDGTITGRSEGRARIVATAGGVADTASLRVEPESPGSTESPPVADVALSFPSESLRVGEELRGAVTATDSQGREVDRSTAWRSLDPRIASVAGDGTITGQSEGRARIVATAGGVADTASLRVRAEPDPRTVLDRQVDALLLGPELDPEEARARADTARTYWQREDLPADLRAHAAWALANSFEIRGRPSDACRWIRRALELTPGIPHYETFRSAVCPQGAPEDGEAP